MILAIKLVMTIGAVSLWLLTQKMLGRRQMFSREPIGDYLHVLTNNWNDYLNKTPQLANGLLISSSLIIDILGLFLIFETLLGNSIRPLLALLIIFSLRQLNQAVTILPTPKGMIWRDPGVPSIFVTYGVSNDLFFSGHTALAVLGAIEIFHLGGTLFTGLSIFVVVFEISVILLLRAHWTMDIFAGAITALWTHEIGSKIAPTLDKWINTFGS